MAADLYERLAIETAEHLGLTEQIAELAQAGKRAREISRELDYQLTPDQIRAVRDHLGIVYPPGTEMR